MNILTFDVEDWFHILDNESTRSADDWRGFESRIHVNMHRLFAILEQTDSKATFFVLGWIAEKYPEVVRSITEKGFEIGCHGYYHQLVYDQSPDGFQEDLDMSLRILEDVSGQKVKYYRAPGFSVRESEKWVFERLIEAGIEVDCSVFPAPRGHGGFPSYWLASPSLIKYNGATIKELPINYINLGGKPIIYSGGGYFRLLPYWVIKKWTANQDYVMSYLHPRDFDPGQPVIKDLSLFRKFKSYVGIKYAERKLEKWLTDFAFTDIQTAVKQINWEQVPVVEL